MSVSSECFCCQVEVSATGRSLNQRSSTECGVSECDLEASTVRRPRPTGAFEPRKDEEVEIGNISASKTDLHYKTRKT